jgi:hypothetical protein
MFLVGVHIHSYGNGFYWFRFYSESLGKAPSNQGLLPLSFGASLWLGMPSLRSCSVGPPPSAIHGRGRLTRHPCRVAHCAEPPLGLSRGRIPQKHHEAAYRPACLFKLTHSSCGSGLARESGGSGTLISTDTTPSRASPLPHLDFCQVRAGCTPPMICWSGLEG